MSQTTHDQTSTTTDLKRAALFSTGPSQIERLGRRYHFVNIRSTLFADSCMRDAVSSLLLHRQLWHKDLNARQIQGTRQYPATDVSYNACAQRNLIDNFLKTL
jgi:hypothetical protein